jgi:hypothetical protein
MSDADRRERLFAQLKMMPSPTRATYRLRNLVVILGAVLAMFILFEVLGGVRAGGERIPYLVVERPNGLIMTTASGASLLAFLAVWALFGRGGSMLGRSGGWLVAGSMVVIASLFTWKLLVSASYAEMTSPWPSRPGLRCLGASAALGIWPLLALSYARRRSDAVHPSMTGASIGVSAGAVTWVLVDLWCPVAYVPHLLLGHVLPVLLFAAAGSLVGRRWVSLRRYRSSRA